MTINQARAEAAKRSQANRKAYILADDGGNYTVHNAPLPGYFCKYENGIEVMKKKTEPAKPAAKVAADKAPKTKVKVSKATKEAIVAAIKEEAPAPEKFVAEKLIVTKPKKEKAAPAPAPAPPKPPKVTPAAKPAKPSKVTPEGKPAKKEKIVPLKGALPQSYLVRFIEEAQRTREVTREDIEKFMEKRGGNNPTSISVSIGRLVNHPYIKLKDNTYSYKK